MTNGMFCPRLLRALCKSSFISAAAGLTKMFFALEPCEVKAPAAPTVYTTALFLDQHILAFTGCRCDDPDGGHKPRLVVKAPKC